MNVVGVVRIFSRSIETRMLCYTDYYGNGDSKILFSVQNIYAPKVVSKKFKKTEIYLTKLGLTDKIIHRLQNYYGIDIRSNVGDLDKMTKSIFAVLFHVCTVHLVLIVGVHTN